MVDLAGSERLNTQETGQVQGETGYINKSLFALTNVINKLSDNRIQHIPYRDSKLTRIIQQSLSGTALSCIICCISPAVCNYIQSISTLKFAQRALQVSVRAKKNETQLYSNQNSEIQQELEDLQYKYQEQSEKMKELEIINQQLEGKLEVMDLQQSQIQLLEQQQQQQFQNQTYQSDYIKQIQEQVSDLNQEIQQLTEQLAQKTEEIKEKDKLLNAQNNRSQLINSQKKQFTDFSQDSENQNYNDSVQNIVNNETNFLDILITQYISPLILPKNQNNNQNLINHKNNQKIEEFFAQIKLTYKKQLNELQNQIKNEIKQNLNLLVPQNSYQEILPVLQTVDQNFVSNCNQDSEFLLLNQIEQKQVFQDLKHKYSQIFYGSQKEIFTIFQEKYNQESFELIFSEIYQEFDKVYEESRAQLEIIFRKKIAFFKQLEWQNNYQTSIDSLKITSEHENQLQNLRKIYNTEISYLQQLQEEIFKNYQFQSSHFFTQSRENSDFQNSFKNNPESQNQTPNLKNSFLNSNNQNNKNQNNYNSQNNQKNYNDNNNYDNQNSQNFSCQNSDFTSQFTNSNLPLQEANNKINQSIQEQQQNSFLKNQQNFQLQKKNYSTKNKLNLEFNNFEPGNLFVWGSGKDGLLGLGDEQSQKLPKILNFPKKTLLKHISCGYHSTLAVTVEGEIYVWGRNNRGQLAIQNNYQNINTPMLIPFFQKNQIQIQQVCAGWQHSLALTNNGQVYSWGGGEDGQLGHGNFQNYITPKRIESIEQEQKIIKIAAGHSHSALITENGILLTFGCNQDYRLMQNNNFNQGIPQKTQLSQTINQPVIDVALGVTHTLALTQNGEVYGAGSGSEGQLGQILSEESQNCHFENYQYQQSEYSNNQSQNESFQSKGSQIQLQNNQISSHLIQIKKFGKKLFATQIAAGDQFSIVLTKNNQIYTFGKTSYSRLGLKEIQKEDAFVYEPSLINVPKNEQIKQIECGIKHAGFLTQSGKIYAWGFNFYEQIGAGKGDQDIQIPTLVKNFNNQNVKFISFGHFSSAAISAPN